MNNIKPFNKYLRGYETPAFVRYAPFVCLNCGTQPLRYNSVECDACRLNGREEDLAKRKTNQEISIAIGCVILSIIDIHLTNDQRKSAHNARESVYAWFMETWYKENSNYKEVHDLLGPWINKTSIKDQLTFSGQDLVEHYLNAYNDLKGRDFDRADYISSIEVKKLFGNLSYSIDLPGSFGIIVGPNAIGKTTIFNLVQCLLLEPKFAAETENNIRILLETEYEGITVSFKGGGKITAERSDKGVTISYKNMDNMSGFTKENAELETSTYLQRNISFKDLAHKYNEHFEKIRLFLFFLESNEGMFYFTKVNRINDFDSFARILRNEFVHTEITLQDVESLIERYKTPTFVTDFKNGVVTYWHSLVSSMYNLKKTGKPLNLNPFQNETFSMIEKSHIIDDFEEVEEVKDFLSNGKLFLGTVKDKNSRCINDAISGIADFVRKFEYYQNCFKDFYFEGDLSSKYPIIRGNALIEFCCGDTNVVIPSASLSSGELNIATVLYDVIFKTRNGSVILIDEPEISLHLVWQQHFTEAIMDILKDRGRTTQVIIASHSPFISSGHDDFITGASLYES